VTARITNTNIILYYAHVVKCTPIVHKSSQQIINTLLVYTNHTVPTRSMIRLSRYGINMRKNTIRNFLSKIKINENGCWIWTGHLHKNGYGKLTWHQKTVTAHRLIYEYYHGQIDPSLTIDHLCRNRACCNPVHLEQVTMKENVLRGTSFAATNAVKTHCPKGHPYTPENTSLHTGRRHCRICDRLANVKWKANNC